MKRVVCIFSLLPIFLFLTGCKDGLQLERPVEIRAFSLGYNFDNSSSARRFEDSRFSDSMYSAFNSKEDIENAKDYKKYLDIGTSRFEYVGETTFIVKTVPEDAMVGSMLVTSSDPEILEIVKITGKNVSVRLHNVGDVEVSVTVNGVINTMSAEFPLRIVSPINIDFYITPYWCDVLNTRLRMRATSLPLGLKSCATVFRDSVSVVGYCEYYDFEKYGRHVQVKRDTIRYAMEEKTCLIKKNQKKFIRNISSAVNEINYQWYVDGSRLVVHDDVTDTIPQRYRFIVETVIVDFDIFGANPYYEYYLTSKSDRMTDVIVIDEETGKPTGEIKDGGSDEDEEYNAALDDNEIERESKAYFVIRYNDFMSQAERDSLSRVFNNQLKEINYDDSRLTDEEKEHRLKELEILKNKGE